MLAQKHRHRKVGLLYPWRLCAAVLHHPDVGSARLLAGCREIVLCSPPDANGKLHLAILFAARTVGVTKVSVSGRQAIAAMTYGTASVPKVYKIFGPGNQYVTCAKQLVQQEATQHRYAGRPQRSGRVRR